MNRFVLPVANLPTSFQDIATEMENVFDHLFNGKANGEGATSLRYAPRLSIVEFEDKFEITVDLPGMSAEDVQIEFKDDQLTIAGERKLAPRAENTKVWRDERAAGRFKRVLQLPETANSESIDAVYDSGVLTVTVAKVAKPAPRQIAIRTNSASGANSQAE